MSRYRKLTTACLAAALALGLAACGGGGSSNQANVGGGGGGGGTGGGGSDVCAMPSQACVDAAQAALTAAQSELAALLADPKSTQAQITAARAAVTAAQTALSAAQTALATYNAAQPPTYALKAIDDAIKSPTALPTAARPKSPAQRRHRRERHDRGGKVTVNDGTPPANTFSEATWPIGKITGWSGQRLGEVAVRWRDRLGRRLHQQAGRRRAPSIPPIYVKNTSGTLRPLGVSATGFSWAGLA